MPMDFDGWFHKRLEITLAETNMAPKIGHAKRKYIFQSLIFRGELLVSGTLPPGILL